VEPIPWGDAMFRPQLFFMNWRDTPGAVGRNQSDETRRYPCLAHGKIIVPRPPSRKPTARTALTLATGRDELTRV